MHFVVVALAFSVRQRIFNSDWRTSLLLLFCVAKTIPFHTIKYTKINANKSKCLNLDINYNFCIGFDRSSMHLSHGRCMPVCSDLIVLHKCVYHSSIEMSDRT